MNTVDFNYYLKRIKDSESAFDKIYLHYYPKIVHHLIYRFHSQTLAVDIAQDFFTKLIEMPTPEYINSPNAWIYTIVDNLAKNSIAKESRYKRVDISQVNIKFFDKYFENNFGFMFDIIQKLDYPAREIIAMRLLEGYSFKEISQALAINHNTVRQIYSRNIKKLKNM